MIQSLKELPDNTKQLHDNTKMLPDLMAEVQVLLKKQNVQSHKNPEQQPVNVNMMEGESSVHTELPPHTQEYNLVNRLT